jgi:hypothetical protein
MGISSLRNDWNVPFQPVPDPWNESALSDWSGISPSLVKSLSRKSCKAQHLGLITKSHTGATASLNEDTKNTGRALRYLKEGLENS